MRRNVYDDLAEARDHLTHLQGQIDALPTERRGTLLHADLVEALAAEMAHVRRLLFMAQAPPHIPPLPREEREEVLSLKEVARITQRDVRTVQRWAHVGKLKTTWRGGYRFVLATSLEVFLKENHF